VGLVRLGLYEASPSSTATWKTSPNDPRERMRTWLKSHARDAQILKDDASTQASWECIFHDPPYPLSREFRAASAPVQGLYVVGQPNSELELGVRYNEEMPMSIYTMDSTGVTGVALAWRMEAELRYVIEEKTHGSLWTLKSRRGEPIHLGSVVLYHIPTVVNYRRTSEWGKA